MNNEEKQMVQNRLVAAAREAGLSRTCSRLYAYFVMRADEMGYLNDAERSILTGLIVQVDGTFIRGAEVAPYDSFDSCGAA